MKRVVMAVAPMTADRAVDDILEAACGYARQEKRHIRKVSYRAGEAGCDPVDWQTLKARITAVIGELVAEEGA